MNRTANSDFSTAVFDSSDADVALQKAIQKHLEGNPELNFSELCEEALRHFLVATDSPASLTLLLDLQQQITELRINLEALEDTVAEHRVQMRQHQDQRATALAARLEKVERHLRPESVKEIAEAPSLPEPDPLIQRMAALLEDF